jgi:hypothetical protein
MIRFCQKSQNHCTLVTHSYTTIRTPPPPPVCTTNLLAGSWGWGGGGKGGIHLAATFAAYMLEKMMKIPMTHKFLQTFIEAMSDKKVTSYRQSQDWSSSWSSRS